jgi:hypothetical protein
VSGSGVERGMETTLYDRERKYLLHLAICLAVEFILFLIVLRGLSHCKIIYRSLSDGKYHTNTINNFCLRGGALFLTFIRVLMFIFLAYSIAMTYVVDESVEWTLYPSWIKFLGLLYFFIVSILSARKVFCCPLPDVQYSLVDPQLTNFANNLFNMLVPVSFVASGMSGFVHHEIIYADHAVAVFAIIEIALNTFRVDAGDLFLSISFSYVYICFVWLTSALLEVSDWPHNRFKLKNMWNAIASYNIFILSHFICFVIHYGLKRFIFSSPIPAAKISAVKDGEGFSSITSAMDDRITDVNNDSVVPINHSDSGEQPLVVQDIESNIQESHVPEPEPQREEIKKPEQKNERPSSPTNDAATAALLGQMIEERTEKKMLQVQLERLRKEMLELKDRNVKDHQKLEKVVDRLGERDLQLKGLESWLAAKNDEELMKIKMQMAEKLNDITHRPKTVQGERTQALHDIDASAPVQTKNLQALSALRNLKMRKLTMDIDDPGEKKEDTNTKFNMYQTL